MPPDPPQVLFVDLSAADGGRWGPQPWRPAAADLAGCAPWAGGGLATLLLLESARAGEHGAFALAVGDGVRRGVPTAARATVAARAPLTGRLAEGLVGGGLGRRLAGLADALLLRGTVPGGAGVLVLERDGARLERMPELAGLDPVATHAALERRLGRCASLRVGAAGERGLPVASLAGSDRVPSFVGRGGLGAAFAGLGLKALAVTASELATSPDPELVQALTASPRLQARAAGGTFELGPARAARGELDRDAGQALARDAAETPRERVGCRGCPTPCGWAFTRPSSGGAGSPGQPARFGKLWSLGPPLGLASFDDALRLAAACDRVGVDAKEVGAALGLLARERGALGDLERLCAWVDALGSERDEEARLIGRGAAAVAAALGRPSPTRAGEARDPDRGAAAVLAARVSSNGADPMRVFPFLLEAGGRARLAELLAGVPLPPGADDPGSTAGKGRIVWWHENLAAALDLTGFCSFSAAGLLADGVLDLDALAARLLPAPLASDAAPGRALLDAGARLVALRRALARHWTPARRSEEAEEAEEALLDEPGMLPEYERWRADGWAAAEEPVEPVSVPESAPPRPAPRTAPAGGARIRLRAAGGAELALAFDAAVTLREVLARAAEVAPEALAEVLPLASVYRDGERLRPEDGVAPGDVLDVVLAIAGG